MAEAVYLGMKTRKVLKCPKMVKERNLVREMEEYYDRERSVSGNGFSYSHVTT